MTRVEVLTAPPPHHPRLLPPRVPRTQCRPAGSGTRAAPPATKPEYQIGWLPGGILFKPLIADPRWPQFSAAYQYYIDNRQFDNVAAVSFGETFTIYRNRLQDMLWELGLQAGVFSLFNLAAESKDLINADYMAAVVAGFRWKDTSALARIYHQSSHLGDEFLLSNSSVQRVNLSYEGADLRLSYEFWPGLRVYGGGGGIFDQEPSDLKPWYAQGGLEFRSPWPAGARIRPVAAVDVQTRQQNDWSPDLSARAGVEPSVRCTVATCSCCWNTSAAIRRMVSFIRTRSTISASGCTSTSIDPSARGGSSEQPGARHQTGNRRHSGPWPGGMGSLHIPNFTLPAPARGFSGRLPTPRLAVIMSQL